MKTAKALPRFDRPGQPAKQWTFLNNHAHVLVCLALDPEIVLREVAQKVGITERATQLIVKDLVDCGVLTRSRKGRSNSYRIDPDVPLRHPLERDHTVGELLAMLLSADKMAQVRHRQKEPFRAKPPGAQD